MHRLNLELAHLIAEAKTTPPALKIALNAKEEDEALLQKLSFNLLSPDLQDKLASYLDYERITYLSQLSLFPATFDTKLVNHAVCTVLQGDLPQTEILIKQRPSLTALKGTATDYSNRTLKEATPFQAALCAWDNEMCEILQKYMDPKEVARQYQEIFPQGHEKYFASQQSFDFSALIGVITRSSMANIKAALGKQQNGSRLCQELNQFRVNFTHHSQQEKVFNPQHLIKAYQLYDEYYEQWNWEQRGLFWRQVVGYVQRFLPANIAQDTAQGLYYRVEEKEKARRSFNFRFGDGSIFPLDLNSQKILGFDFAASARALDQLSRAKHDWSPSAFIKLISNKNKSLAKLPPPSVLKI